MDYKAKRFIKNVKMLALHNNLKCRVIIFRNQKGFDIDFQKRSKRFVYYVEYFKEDNSYELINHWEERTIKTLNDPDKMLKFLEIFIKRNYRKF
jgi:hypothetical protein